MKPIFINTNRLKICAFFNGPPGAAGVLAPQPPGGPGAAGVLALVVDKMGSTLMYLFLADWGKRYALALWEI